MQFIFWKHGRFLKDRGVISMLNLLSLVVKLSQNFCGWSSARALFLPSIVHHVSLSPTPFFIKLFLTEQSALNPSEPVALAWFSLFSLFFPQFSHQNISHGLALWGWQGVLSSFSFPFSFLEVSLAKTTNLTGALETQFSTPDHSHLAKQKYEVIKILEQGGCCVCVWLCMVWALSPCIINDAQWC